jgi:putative transposase
MPERAGAEAVLALAREQSPTAQVVWADGGYCGEKFTNWCRQTLALILLIVKKPLGIKTFLLLPRRWVVERTFGWLGKFRRLARDYETKSKNSKGWIFVAMIQLMSRRLGRE